MAEVEESVKQVEPPKDKPESPDRQEESPPAIRKYAIRFGYLGFVGEFTYKGEEKLKRGQKVVLRSQRGREVGEVICLITDTPDPENPFELERKTVQKYVEASGQDYLQPDAGEVLRVLTDKDIRELETIKAEEEMEREFAAEVARKQNLPMRLVRVEHLFGGEKIIFYFTAPGRVDFRQMVRELARRYRTRIELRQIGARDEARLLADYEICGRECCCKNFLKTLRPISMKMAKLQKSTLDPSKVSGRCGRLRCCLQYEHKTYEELISTLPSIGSWVSTALGVGKVKDRSPITQLVQVVFEDNRLVSFPVEEISPAQKPEGVDDKLIVEEEAVPDEELAKLELADEEESSLNTLYTEETETTKPAGSNNRKGAEKKPREYQKPKHKVNKINKKKGKGRTEFRKDRHRKRGK